MGKDNLFHKVRERKALDLDRKKQIRQRQPRVLIVCEDSKSSAYYFQDMTKAFGLSAVDVRGKECGSAPSSVLQYAEQEYEQEKSSDPYDRVYCVFDRDQHRSFLPTVKKISALKISGKPFFAITSTPCFEIWLLLHFDYISHPFTARKRSPCDEAISELHKEAKLDGYKKGIGGVYAKLSGQKMQDAIKHAKRLLKDNKRTGSDNPETNVYELVEYLASLTKPTK
ncbi:MAG: RloB domain-containing protein [Nitrosomonadales bacterium]|nr:RloB domain-containing protein [Nitrosomonadales bacterium]